MNTRPNPLTAVATKALEYVGLVLFTVLVPRVMGPQDYGTFAAVLAVVGLFTVMTGLGANTTFGRFVPEYLERADRGAIERLYTQLLAVRVLMVVPLGLILTLMIGRMLPEVGAASAAMGAGAFMFGAVGMTGYQLMYGLNRLGRSLIRGALSRLLLALGILAIGPEISPRGAISIMFAVEIVLGILGFGLATSYLRPKVLATEVGEVRAALRFGAVFFGATLLLTAVWRGGEIAVAVLTDSREEIAFYSIASVIVMSLSSLLSQASTLMLPTVTRMHLRGEDARFVGWVSASLRYVTLLAVLGALGVLAVSDRVIPLILGDGFGRVALNLKILVLGLVPLAVVRTATTTAVVKARAREVVLMGAEGLAGFALISLALVPRVGSIGASIAVTAAFLVAGFRAIYRMDLDPFVIQGMYWKAVTPGALLALLFLIPNVDPLLTGAVTIATYVAITLRLGVLKADELRSVAQSLRPRGT